NYDDGDTLVAYPKIATDTNTGNYIIVDLPIGLNSFSIGRWKGGSTFTVFGVKVFVTDDSQSVSTRLSDLKIGGTTIDGFSANVLEYDIATPNDAATSTPAVTATAEDATNTTVTLNPVSGIAEYVDGAASVTITVAENGKRDTRVYTVNFAKDVVAPTILSTPVEGAAVAKTGNITLNFSEAITINAACLDAIQLNGNTPTNPGVLAGNGLSWTLAYVDADWNATDALQLAVPAGYFTDGLNNFTSAFLLNLVFDETAPVLVSTTPVEGASNALRKSSAKIEFNETIDTLSFRNSGSINLIVAGQSVTATYTASDRVITIPYEGNWNDTVAISITGIKDIAGNETAVPVTLNFTIDEPLAKFNYAFNTNNKTVADAPGWIEYNTGKQLNPIYTQSSTCADQTLGAYRFESGDTVCLHLAKAGKVSIKVTANGNRIIGISDTYTGTLLKHWYNNTCNGNFTKEINTNEPVTVYIYGETGIANEFGGSSSTNVITTSGTIFEISVNHPIELATPVVADVLPVNNDYSGFQFGFDITAVPNATQYIIYYGTDSAAVANKTASTKTVDNPGQNPTIYVTIGSTEFIGQLSPKTTYYYAVEAIISGEGSDAAEGQILHSKLSLVKKNKTLGAPAIVSTIPATGNLLPLYDGSIVINFDEKIVVNPDVADTIRLGETPSFGDGISNPVECHASISADSLSITVTYPGSLAESANIRLQIPANKYMNLAETKLPLTNLAFTSPTLLSAPVVITATGFNGDATINLIDGENIPLSYLTYSVIEITFDKAITKVDDIPLTISDGTATTDVTGMVLLYGGNKIFGAQLSAYDWQRGKTYTIAIPDSAFVDANTTPNAAYNFTFSTEAAPIEYVQDVVYYTDFATNPGGYTPMIAHWADSVVANNLESQRYSPTFSAGETFSFDGYTFVPTGSNRRIDFYGYNSNSTVGPIVGLSYGRLALNNASQRLDLPTFTGPFTIRWSYNNGGANMRVMQLREGSNVLAADTVGGADAPNYPSAIFGQYVETRTDNINYNLFSAVNAAGFQDLEIFKTIATTNVTPLISHWFNPTKSVDLNSGADIDIRFTKRIKLLDPSLITITNSTVDSVKVVGNALRVWFSTTAYNSTVTVNIPVGTVAQETTNQPLTMPAQWDFTIGNYVATLPVEFENISIYPNPATDELKIECGKLNIRSVEIYDISGKCIYYSQLSTLNSQLSINISQFKSGVYFMRITGSNNEMKIAKIVKQ
ncbi:MAG: Ig-like domain-containing protein, partial [Bacteroidales bacterium]|nr:Ig-like domain-containing protein [Bacteroidales bacterium]